jgi:hypothetical protein
MGHSKNIPQDAFQGHIPVQQISSLIGFVCDFEFQLNKDLGFNRIEEFLSPRKYR